MSYCADSRRDQADTRKVCNSHTIRLEHQGFEGQPVTLTPESSYMAETASTTLHNQTSCDCCKACGLTLIDGWVWVENCHSEGACNYSTNHGCRMLKSQNHCQKDWQGLIHRKKLRQALRILTCLPIGPLQVLQATCQRCSALLKFQGTWQTGMMQSRKEREASVRLLSECFAAKCRVAKQRPRGNSIRVLGTLSLNIYE